MDYWVPFPSSEYGGVLTIIAENDEEVYNLICSEDGICLLYTSPSPRDATLSRMPSSA